MEYSRRRTASRAALTRLPFDSTGKVDKAEDLRGVGLVMEAMSLTIPSFGNDRDHDSSISWEDVAAEMGPSRVPGRTGDLIGEGKLVIEISRDRSCALRARR